MTITSVWSSYGHRFIGGDCDESCLTCGAMYTLVADSDDPTRGEYQAVNGDDPVQCTGDTTMAHGYPGERVCHDPTCDPSEPCEHVTHDCNCLLCDS